MITYENSKSWQRPVAIALIGGAVIAGGIWMWGGSSGTDATTPVAESASQPVASNTTANSGQDLSTPTAPVAPTTLADGRPSDFSPAVWNVLNKAMTNKPYLKPEVEKVMSYMRFQRSFEYWQSLENTRDVQQRRQLGQSMLEQMPDRLAKGEFTMSEGLMMATALLSDIEPDEKKRELLVEDWGKKFAAVAPQPTDDAQLQELQKRTEDRRIVPGLLTESPNPDQAQVEKALEERMRISPH
ncbi:MAG: hypothetical protein EOP38_03080 [Rubrivivax sp.]|nr:MAG: hypothetical protein EOP38_03080 [Rubrivivax sp.]